MSSELTVISPKSIEEAKSLAQTLSTAHTLPEALRQKPADILATVLTGAELGLAPMQAIRGIAIIKGKPTLSADTMGALVKRRADVCEYLVMKEGTAERCTYEAKRKGDPAPTTMSFTMQDAQRAGLNGDNWRKYPQAMLRARCLSAICRAVFPDLCLGLYDPDELAEAPTAAAPVEKDVTPPTTTAPKTSAEAKKVLEAKLAVVNGAVAETTKADPRAIWERCVALGSQAGMEPKAVGARLKLMTGKPDWKSLTEADLKAFASWLDDAPAEPDPDVLNYVNHEDLPEIPEAAPF